MDGAVLPAQQPPWEGTDRWPGIGGVGPAEPPPRGLATVDRGRGGGGSAHRPPAVRLRAIEDHPPELQADPPVDGGPPGPRGEPGMAEPVPVRRGGGTDRLRTLGGTEQPAHGPVSTRPRGEAQTAKAPPGADRQAMDGCWRQHSQCPPRDGRGTDEPDPPGGWAEPPGRQCPHSRAGPESRPDEDPPEAGFYARTRVETPTEEPHPSGQNSRFVWGRP